MNNFYLLLALLLIAAAATRQPAPVTVGLGGAPWWTLIRWKTS